MPSPFDRFYRAIDCQPKNSFPKWKSRGFNSLVRFEEQGKKPDGTSTVPVKDWTTEAATQALPTVRVPDPSVSLSGDRPANLAGWMHRVVYNGKEVTDEYDRMGVPTQMLIDSYKAFKVANPTMPVVQTISGNVLGWDEAKLAAYFGQSCDVMCFNTYPVTGFGQAWWQDRTDPRGDFRNGNTKAYWYTHSYGAVIDKLKRACPGKPILAHVELGNNFNVSWVPAQCRRGATFPEVRNQIFNSINHGVCGVVGFPQRVSDINGFSYDDVPAAVMAEIVTLNAFLASIDEVLREDTQSLTLPTPFDGCAKNLRGDQYKFILNASYANATIDGRKYEPHGVKVLKNGRLLWASDGTPPEIAKKLASVTVRYSDGSEVTKFA